MKNKVQDVRNLVVAMMELLDTNDGTPEEMAQRIERAKATSMLAGQYTSLVKLELDAVRLLSETGLLPSSVEQPTQPNIRLVSGGRSA